VCSHPNGVIPKMRRKVRSSLNWQGALKQKGMKQTCIEQGLPVIPCDICCSKSIVKITVRRRSILYVLKFTSALKICHKFTVCNSVMFYVNLLSVFLKVYNKPVVSRVHHKTYYFVYLQLCCLIITNGNVSYTRNNLFLYFICNDMHHGMFIVPTNSVLHT